MQPSKIIAVAAMGLAAGVARAEADVTVSVAATHNMNCNGSVCAPTAPGAVLNIRDLESMLAAGAVAVTTTGEGVQANNIRVRAKLSWRAASVLTLDAFKSVIVEQPVTVAGPGGVSVAVNDGGSGGDFSFAPSGRMRFANPSGSLVIDGAAYTLETGIAALSAAIAGNPSGSYALADNYDANRDGTYTASPIGTTFTGNFNGLGNTISNLAIDDPTDNVFVGLFAETANGATLSNIRLENERVTGASGNSDETLTESVGGLVGYADGGTIADSFVRGAASSGTYAPIGGIAGVIDGAIRNSGSAMSISGGSLGAAGGLAGIASAAVSHSYASGNVSGSGFVGGLVGFANGKIRHSHATGAVAAIDDMTYAGGLAGMNQTDISRSYATGLVACSAGCGGLVGFEGGGAGSPAIRQSFATGTVSGNSGTAGGLVGVNEIGSVADSYASGTVFAQTAGGFVGTNTNNGSGLHSVLRCYSTGAVNGGTYAGGLIGADEFTSTIERAYWDMTTSGIANKGQGAGNVADDPGIKGLSNTKLQSGLPKGFNPRIWGENSGINGGLPYLLAIPPAN